MSAIVSRYILDENGVKQFIFQDLDDRQLHKETRLAQIKALLELGTGEIETVQDIQLATEYILLKAVDDL